VTDDITRDPEREQQIEHIWKVAAQDARSNREPRTLVGLYADLQHEYDAAYTEEQLAMAASEEPN
jgi:hypothetical protein